MKEAASIYMTSFSRQSPYLTHPVSTAFCKLLDIIIVLGKMLPQLFNNSPNELKFTCYGFTVFSVQFRVLVYSRLCKQHDRLALGCVRHPRLSAVTPHCSLLPPPGNHQSVFYLCGFACSGHSIYTKLSITFSRFIRVLAGVRVSFPSSDE